MTPGENAETIIRERAYHIWESSGRPDGRADEHWFQAIHEVSSAPSMVTPEPARPAKARTAARKPLAAERTTPRKATGKRRA